MQSYNFLLDIALNCIINEGIWINYEKVPYASGCWAPFWRALF